MKDDPTITRIRQVRHSISEKHGHDPKRLAEYYMDLQKKHKDRFVIPSEIKKEPFVKA